jgi:hypothetical protein
MFHISRNIHSKISKDKIVNSQVSTSSQKIPIYNTLSSIGSESGYQGDIVFQQSNLSFYGFDGFVWKLLSGGGGSGSSIWTLDNNNFIQDINQFPVAFQSNNLLFGTQTLNNPTPLISQHKMYFIADDTSANAGAFRAGTVKTEWDTINVGANSVAMCDSNIVSGSSCVGFGKDNILAAQIPYSSILGGNGNKILFVTAGQAIDSHVICAGVGNIITDGIANFIGGGYTNNIYIAAVSSIIGGQRNSIGNSALLNPAPSSHCSIVGGADNKIAQTTFCSHSSILCGAENEINGNYSVIATGSGNKVLASDSGGGYCGIITGNNNIIDNSINSTILNGNNCTIGQTGPIISCTKCIIGQGDTNKIGTTANCNTSSIFNGTENTINGNTNTILNGLRNNISANFSTITNGNTNKITNTNHGMICTGIQNEIGTVSVSGNQSAILSGTINKIGTTATVNNSSIIAGNTNTIDNCNNSSILAGNNLILSNDNVAMTQNMYIGKQDGTIGGVKFLSVVFLTQFSPANYTMTPENHTIIADLTGGLATVNIFLPQVSISTGTRFFIKRTDNNINASLLVNIDLSDTVLIIDKYANTGSAPSSGTLIALPYALSPTTQVFSIEIICDGQNWQIL